MSETIIKLEHVRKTYRSYKSNFQKMKHMLILSGAGEKNRILKDVSFTVKKGEKVAILSPAGGGKSTMLRILAGIIKPDAGTVEVVKEPKLILDYRAGFDTALSAADNYRIRAKLEGWSDDHIESREKEIFKTASLLHDKNKTLKNCPRGSAIKLGFAIATYEKADLILMDEKLSFGKNTINERYTKRFADLITEETTLVMAGNDLKITALFCERGIVIHDGKLVFDGPFEEALSYHKEHASVKREKRRKEELEESLDINEADSEDAF